MVRALLSFCLCAFLFPAVSAADSFPTRPEGRVTDQARVLDSTTRLQLEQILADLDRKTGAEVAVVSVSSLDGEPIENAAVTLFSRFGIGKKGKDNGVLFLIAPQDRKVRIEVGYGLEGVITDAMAGQIIQNRVLPSFRSGDLKTGVIAGTLSLAQMIAEDAQVSLSAPDDMVNRVRYGSEKKVSLGQFIFTLVLLIILVPILIRHPWLIFFLLAGRGGGGYRGGGGGFGGGFGGFGGGMSGGGGASGGW